MENKFNRLLSAVLASCLICRADSAWANVAPIVGDRFIDGIISTVIYGVIGIVMAAFSFKVIDGLTPGDLKKQLTEEKNLALGVVVGLQALGISIIIAAAIAG